MLLHRCCCLTTSTNGHGEGHWIIEGPCRTCQGTRGLQREGQLLHRAKAHDSSSRGSHGRDEQKDKSMVKCYNCQALGHFAWECPKKNKNEFALFAVASNDDEPALL